MLREGVSATILLSRHELCADGDVVAVSYDANEVDEVTNFRHPGRSFVISDSWLSVMQRIDAPAKIGAKVTNAIAMARSSSSPMQRLLRRNADAISACESL